MLFAANSNLQVGVIRLSATVLARAMMHCAGHPMFCKHLVELGLERICPAETIICCGNPA